MCSPVVVRPYDDLADRAAVLRIFTEGMLGLVPHGTYAIYSILACPLAAACLAAAPVALHKLAGVRRVPAAAVGIAAFGGAMAYLWRYMRKAMEAYVEDQLRKDLSDIPGHYLCRADTHFWVAVDSSGDVIGCVALDSPVREPAAGAPPGPQALAKYTAEPSYGELRRMSVSAAARGRGVALGLHTELERFARAKGLGGIFLRTSSMQHAAVALYRKLGYTLVSHRPIPMPILGLAIQHLEFCKDF
jgi:ribosomal protein S18 acetylase RimI-like enzyme